jgi:hypothetical protein
VKQPSKPDRVAGFTKYVKGLVRLWPAITAAAPIPVTVSGLLPVYAAQRKLLMGLAASFGFLLFLFIFYSRHELAKWMFAGTRATRSKVLLWLAPLAFILLSAASLFGYLSAVNNSLDQFAARGVLEPSETVLEHADWGDIPGSITMAALYIGIFAFAQSAFILMAVREYMQDVLGLSEARLSGRRGA